MMNAIREKIEFVAGVISVIIVSITFSAVAVALAIISTTVVWP